MLCALFDVVVADRDVLVPIDIGRETVTVTLDEVFSEIVALMVHMFRECARGRAPWVHRNLWVAMQSLRRGPWTLQSAEIQGTGMGFGSDDHLLTGLVDILETASSRPGTREAIAQARYWMGPNPDPRLGPVIPG